MSSSSITDLVNKTAFPFGRLPKELRLRVLAYTDLIARPIEGKTFQGGFRINTGGWRFQKNRCKYCCKSSRRHCRCTWYSLGEGVPCTCICTCICTCPFDPRPMLLVSRQFSWEASELFYSNRFCFIDEKHGLNVILGFFRHHSPPALHLMRNITLDLGWSVYRLWSSENERFTSQWNELLDIMGASCNLSALILTIRCHQHFDRDSWTSTESLSDEDLKPLRDFYTDTFTCLRKLRGLKALIVYLLHEKFWHMEKPFENDVMGEAYSSADLRVSRDACFQI